VANVTRKMVVALRGHRGEPNAVRDVRAPSALRSGEPTRLIGVQSRLDGKCAIQRPMPLNRLARSCFALNTLRLLLELRWRCHAPPTGVSWCCCLSASFQPRLPPCSGKCKCGRMVALSGTRVPFPQPPLFRVLLSRRCRNGYSLSVVFAEGGAGDRIYRLRVSEPLELVEHFFRHEFGRQCRAAPVARRAPARAHGGRRSSRARAVPGDLVAAPCG
jgi:hypothetical protein